jgi:hypothetical protein
MPNKNKQKGDRWELSVVKYLKKWFPKVERRKAGWALDKGDLSGLPFFCVECKDTALTNIGTSMDKALVSLKNTPVEWVVMFQKRRGSGDPGEGYAVMTIEHWAELVDEYIGYATHNG